MPHITINPNEVQQLAFQIFGNKKITAITTDNAMLLTATKRENLYQGDTPISKLCGMFKNTSLLSSDEFAKNKKSEKYNKKSRIF